MRVLIVHNRYRSSAPSGEARVVDLEIDALRARGVDVVTHLRESDEMAGSPIAQAEAALAQVRPAFSLRSLRSLLRRTCPDVVHLHNPFPLVPPALITLAHDEGVGIVQTLHNGRHGCPRADFTRDKRFCTDCVGLAFPAPAVIHRCYRDSASQSFMLAGSLALHRRTFARVDRFIAASEWLKGQLMDSHLPGERIVVVPHGIPDPGPTAWRGESFLFVGRVEEEKGLPTLLDAWEKVGARSKWPLVIAGAGPLEDHVRERVEILPNASYIGRLTAVQVQTEMSKAIAVIVPSMVPESFGMTTIEAFAAGKPVVASSNGALSELVDDDVGWRVAAGSVRELACTLESFDELEAQRCGAAARKRFLERYTIGQSTERLIAVLRSASRR